MKRADAPAVGAALVMVLGTIAGSAVARDRPAQMKRVAAADGVLSLSNSLDNGAIITAHGLLPGQSSSGTITLGNTGEVAGMLALARTWIDDVPGPNGGRLSNVLTLLIEDVSGPQPREILYGEVGGLERMALEPLPGGAQRTYRFTVGFPDSGPHGADNAYIGSELRMDYAVARRRGSGPPPRRSRRRARSPRSSLRRRRRPAAAAPPTGPQPAPSRLPGPAGVAATDAAARSSDDHDPRARTSAWSIRTPSGCSPAATSRAGCASADAS